MGYPAAEYCCGVAPEGLTCCIGMVKAPACAVSHLVVLAAAPTYGSHVRVQMLAAGLQPNLVTYNTLLEVYAKRSMWREAVGVLDTLEQQVSRHKLRMCSGRLRMVIA